VILAHHPFARRSAPLALTVGLAGCAAGPTPAAAPFVSAASPEEAGRYLVLVGGCNDCHTPGWGSSGGRTPERAWLTGSDVGYRGPWGTSYAANLRLLAATHSEQAWIEHFRKEEGAPPMPWHNYRTMPDRDLVAIHRFLRALGPLGTEKPEVVPPGREPATPFILFVPQPPRAGAHP
jgi:mono/diheme cytochrome c family protein